MKVSLVVAQGKRKGKVIPIHGGRFVIGRHKECDLKANGSTISQHHCAILIRDGKAFVRDFDSTNGTYVNQERVQGEQRELAQDDLLKLGRLAFRVRIVDPIVGVPDFDAAAAVATPAGHERLATNTTATIRAITCVSMRRVRTNSAPA